MAFYATNTSTDAAVSATDDKVIKVKQGERVRVRFLPSMQANGQTQFPKGLHYKLKELDDEGKERGLALACLKHHGDGKCPICDVHAVLKGSDDKNERDLTKFPNDIGVSLRVMVPVLESTKGPDGQVWSQPKLLDLTKNAADKLRRLYEDCQNDGIPLFNDVELGQDVVVSNPSTPGEYGFQPTMKQMPLADCVEDLDTSGIEDVTGAMNLTIRSYDEMLAALDFSQPTLDIPAIMEEVNG